jgi:hypothetical protein
MGDPPVHSHLDLKLARLRAFHTAKKHRNKDEHVLLGYAVSGAGREANGLFVATAGLSNDFPVFVKGKLKLAVEEVEGGGRTWIIGRPPSCMYVSVLT